MAALQTKAIDAARKPPRRVLRMQEPVCLHRLGGSDGLDCSAIVLIFKGRF
jgi:hypothetical protein